MKNYLILFLFCLVAVSCEFLRSFGGAVVETASDPAVKDAAGGVINNVITGNWLGALASLGELVAVGGATWKATNMSRDARRKKGTDVKPADSPAVSS